MRLSFLTSAIGYAAFGNNSRNEGKLCGTCKGYRKMDKPIIEKNTCRKWIFSVLAVLPLLVILIIWQHTKQETEYSIIQAVIEEFPDYQNEIESWGYQASVLPKITGKPDNTGFIRYYQKSVGPVLILEDSDGGMYCFYYGFDQYISKKTYTENMLLFPISQYDKKEYKNALKTVRLQICKRNIKQGPLLENTANVDSQDRYDVSVRIEITAKSLEDGDELSVFGGSFFETNYCSNNFEECRLWNGIDPASANSYSDHHIKQEYSAIQLLEYYRQGLELQDRLTKLYHEKQAENDKEYGSLF